MNSTSLRIEIKKKSTGNLQDTVFFSAHRNRHTSGIPFGKIHEEIQFKPSGDTEDIWHLI